MNKLLFLGLAGALIGQPVSESYEVKTLNGISYTKETAEMVEHSVVVEVSMDGQNWRKIGSGTVVDTDQGPAVVTAWHVVEGLVAGADFRACSVLDVQVQGCVPMQNILVDLASTLPTADWAVFLVPEVPLRATTAEVRTSPIEVGEEIWAVGSPAGTTGLVTHGIVSGFERIEGQYMITTDAFVFFGSSGGALYDKKGNLIGVIVAIDSAGNQFFELPLPHLNYSVSTHFIAEFLKDELKFKS